MQDILNEIYDSIVDGDAQGTAEAVKAALAAGVAPATILNDAMIAAMAEVGRLFEVGECFVPEMLIAARAMKQGLAVLKPHLVAANVQPVAKVVLGTVRGDLHDIGKGLVAMMLEGAGFEVIDLGVDAGPEKFVEAVRQHRPAFVGMSALLTTTMPQMRTTIQALEAAGLRDSVTVMVGGAPVTPAFAEEIHADLYAADASSAARLAKAWLNLS
ncbi:MAG: corrinoid protein [Caldilineales bacterium]|nr:corrinoid protein [Caldilineales bacterium]MDW8317931.1 corrinoid protein [Anaerolineae bacterium]